MTVREGAAQPERAGRKEYNVLFEKFVDSAGDGHGRVLGFVAYGIYKQAKREWSADIRDKNGRGPNAEELAAYIATWTPSQIDNAHERAAQAMSAFAQSVIEEATPQILEEALRGSFWRGVFQSALAAFLYTIFLIGCATILAFSGVDLIGIVQKVSGP